MTHWDWPQWTMAVFLIMVVLPDFDEKFLQKYLERKRTPQEVLANDLATVFLLLLLTYAGGFWK